jgi:hypothetical protein
VICGELREDGYLLCEGEPVRELRRDVPAEGWAEPPFALRKRHADGLAAEDGPVVPASRPEDALARLAQKVRSVRTGLAVSTQARCSRPWKPA